MKKRESLRLIILGNPATKKNSQQIYRNAKTGKSFITQSKRYKEYAKTFLWQVPYQAKININYPVNLKCIYYRQTKHRVDLVNLLNATNDLLVEAGVLEDDNCKIVFSHDGSEVRWDKDNPRVEIEITEVK